MKTKIFTKKLIIRKSTVSNLSEAMQANVRGGARPTLPITYCPFTACGDSIWVACVC